MKNIICLAFIILLTYTSCKKEDATNPPDNNVPQFEFTSLVAQDSIIAINGYTGVTATVTGNGLTYTWIYTAGAVIGSGASVQYTVCHAGKFKLTCEVQDADNNKLSKDVYIYAK